MSGRFFPLLYTLLLSSLVIKISGSSEKYSDYQLPGETGKYIFKTSSDLEKLCYICPKNLRECRGQGINPDCRNQNPLPVNETVLPWCYCGTVVGCDPLPVFNNGTYRCWPHGELIGTSYQTCISECEAGFHLTQGNRALRCGEDRRWNETVLPPICVLIIPDVTTVPTDDPTKSSTQILQNSTGRPVNGTSQDEDTGLTVHPALIPTLSGVVFVLLMAPLAWICYRKCKKKYQSWLLRKSTELAVQMPSIGSGSEAIPFPPESDEPVEDDEQSNARTILSVHTSSQSNGDSSDAEEITPFTAAAAKLEKEEEKQGLLDNVNLDNLNLYGESTPASLSFPLMGSGPISIPSTQTGPSQTDSDLSTSNTTQHESGSQQPLPTQSDQNLGRNLPLSGGDGDNDEPLSDVDLCLPSTETLKLPSAELLTPSDFDEDLLGSRHEPEGADSHLGDLPVQQNVPPEGHIELETHQVMPLIESEQGLAALKHFEDPESEAVKKSDLEFTSPSSGFLAMNQAAPDPIQRQAWGHQAEAGHLQDGAEHNQRQAWGHQTGAGQLQDGTGNNQRQAWSQQPGAGQLQDGAGNNQRQAWGHQTGARHLQDGAGHNQRQAWGHQTGAGQLQDGTGNNQRQAWGHQTEAGQLQDGAGNNHRQAWGHQTEAGQLQDGAGNNQRQAWGHQTEAGQLQDGAGNNQRQTRGQQTGAGQLQDGAIHPKQAPYQQVISEEIVGSKSNGHKDIPGVPLQVPDADECVTFSHYQEKRDAFAFFSELDILLSGDNREEQNWFGVCKWILTPYKPPYKIGTWVDYLKSVRTNNKNPTGSSYFHQVLNEQLIQKDVKLGHVLYFYSEKYPHLKIQQLFQQFHPACQYCQQFYQQL